MSNSASHQSQSQAIAQQLETFVSLLLVTLDKKLDKRLVRTFSFYFISDSCLILWGTDQFCDLLFSAHFVLVSSIYTN